jgi:Kef-type K+ transport system membrane component KefB
MSTLTPVEQFLIDLVIILVLARLLGALARIVGQPPVVGEIIAGILLGPTLFSGKLTSHLFLVTNPAKPPAGQPPLAPINLVGSWLTAIATIGLVLFMFIVGYEVDRALFKGREQVAAAVSLGSIALPMAGGTLLGLWLVDGHPDITVKHVPAALFVGAAMSVTAFPVLARILTDRNMHRTRLGGLSIASAAVDDIAAWTLLAVVVTIVGSEASASPTWHILLAPVYLAIMAFVVRPLLRKVNDRFVAIGRLTPDLLGIVVTLLVLSSFATEWMNVHYIFGAFIMGGCMPRESAVALREAILERLEQLSVLVLLPVFFVVSGINVDLSQIDAKGLGELLAILGVAVGGKFLGAYLGARAAGVGSRQAGALATLMNTRGLTELIILNVGLGLGALDPKLFTLMVLMALITTAMTGPIMAIVYPQRLVDRDIADAERAALGGDNAYRVLVVVNSLDKTDLVDTAIDLAVARRPARVVLARLVPQKKTDRLEVGTGLGSELLVMTRTLSDLHTLAGRGAGRGVETPVHVKYSENELSVDLTRLITDLEPDLVLLDGETAVAPHNFMPRIVRQQLTAPDGATEIAVLLHGGGADEAAAVQVGAQLATARGLPLVLVGGRGQRLAAELTRRGIDARGGDRSDTAVVVGSTDAPGTHLVARARPDDAADIIDDWAGSLSAPEPATQEITT